MPSSIHSVQCSVARIPSEEFCDNMTCLARFKMMMEMAKERKKTLKDEEIKRQKILKSMETEHEREEAEAKPLEEKRLEDQSGKENSTNDLVKHYLQKHPEVAVMYRDDGSKAQQKEMETENLLMGISQLIAENSNQLAEEILAEHILKEERHMAEKEWQREERAKAKNAIFDEGHVYSRLDSIPDEQRARQKAVEKEKLAKQIVQLVKENSNQLAVKMLKEHMIIEKRELAEEERQREIRVKEEIGKFDDDHRAIVTSWLDTVPAPKGMERVFRGSEIRI